MIVLSVLFVAFLAGLWLTWKQIKRLYRQAKLGERCTLDAMRHKNEMQTTRGLNESFLSNSAHGLNVKILNTLFCMENDDA